MKQLIQTNVLIDCMKRYYPVKFSISPFTPDFDPIPSRSDNTFDCQADCSLSLHRHSNRNSVCKCLFKSELGFYLISLSVYCAKYGIIVMQLNSSAKCTILK